MVTYLNSWKVRLVVAGIMLSATPTFADDAEGVVRLKSPSPSAGVVRISDQQADSPVVRGQSPVAQGTVVEGPSGETGGEWQSAPSYPTYTDGPIYGDGYVVDGYQDGGYVDGGYSEGGYCPEGGYGPPCEQYCPEFLGHGPLAAWLRMNATAYRSRNQVASHLLKQSIYQDLVDKGRWLRCKFGYFVPTGGCGQGVPLAGKYKMVYPVDPQYFDQRDGQVYAAQGYYGPVSVPLAPVVNHTYNYGWGVPSSRLTPVLHDNHNYPVQGTPVVKAPVAR
ncbi:MAG: hypothetical protein KDA80_16575 [Planctomycetaceae bacterium]|nr:hypothetical protein [Planctomycetaceae bacterium]